MDKEIRNLIPPIAGLGNDWTVFEYEVGKRFEGHQPEAYTLPVSVVIPVYNRKEKLAKTIAALTHQTYPHDLIEIVIADDGSSDHPEELLDTFSNSFSMKYIRQDDDGYRLSEIRNKGVAASSHEQIIILDCDMLPLPSLVESYMKYAHVSKKAVLIGGRRYVNTDDVTYEDILLDINSAASLPSLRTDTGQVPTNGLPPSEDWRYKIYRATNNLKDSKYPFRAFCGGNVCFNKHLIETVGGFDEDFTAWGAEDTEFGYRVYNHGFWLIPVEGAGALHQEPPHGSNETDRDAGKAITQPILVEKCPAFYRKMEKDRIYEVPKVSVYIPAYNAADYIEEAIESALNQTYTDLEVVVVNDGSTDPTGELLDSMYGTHPRVTVIHQENGGISSASNAAIRNCKGEYILQLDSDDALLPEAAEMLVAVLEKNDVGFVYGDAYLTDSEGIAYGRAYSWSMYDRYKLLEGMMIHHPRMFRKRDFNRISGFDTNLSNAVDYDIFLKLAEVTDGYHLQTPLYLYRQHNTNTSKLNASAQDKNNHACIIAAFDRLGLKQRVKFTPDPNHNRKMIKTLVEDCEEYRLDFSYTYNRLGIEGQGPYLHHAWEAKNLVSHESHLRQTSRAISNDRYVRVGSYGSMKVAYSVSSKIEREYTVETSIFSILVKSGTSYFIDVSAPNNDKKTLELMQELMLKYNWKTEVVSHRAKRDIISMNANMKTSLERYMLELQDNGAANTSTEKSKKYRVSTHWNQTNSTLTFSWSDEKVFFEMPTDWDMKETHEDLFRLAHYVLVAPWDTSVLENWKPSRKPGWRPGLAFSGGIDSAAAVALMPNSTVLIYNERSDIPGKLDHTNALRFFEELSQSEQREVVRVQSNHESIRMRDGKMAGFSTDYACAVQVILLADHFGLDSIGTGMPLENTYLWHGYKYRDFGETWFWNHYSKIFEEVGLPLYQPVAGCSEIVNMQIVEQMNWTGFAQSCLRSNTPGKVCGRCWKCFRKNSLLGIPFKLEGEIETFLAKRPLKQAASTLYSIQQGGVSEKGIKIKERFPDLKPLLALDFDFLNRYLPTASELLPPRYRDYTVERLKQYSQPMSASDLEKLRQVDLFSESVQVAED
jgi:chondroitin synthase